MSATCAPWLPTRSRRLSCSRQQQSFYRPLFLCGLGRQARAVLQPLGTVTGADLGPLVAHTLVTPQQVARELEELKASRPGVATQHLMELTGGQLDHLPRAHSRASPVPAAADVSNVLPFFYTREKSREKILFS